MTSDEKLSFFALSESGLCLDGADVDAERVYKELKAAVLQERITPAQASEDAAKAFTRNPDLFTDPYCYPGTSVLLNLMDIRDSDHLQAMGEFVASFRLYELYANLPAPPYDLGYLLEIHRRLFGNIYGFAGKLREYPSRLMKRRVDGSRIIYQNVAFLEMHLAGFFEELAKEDYLAGLDIAEFAKRSAYFYRRIDYAHPFRDGNARAFRIFFSALAGAAGFSFDWARIPTYQKAEEEFDQARDLAIKKGDPSRLAEIFLSILAPQ